MKYVCRRDECMSFAACVLLIALLGAGPAVADEGHAELDDLTPESTDDIDPGEDAPVDDDPDVADLTDLKLDELLERDLGRATAAGIGPLAQTLERGQLQLDYSLEFDSRNTVLDGSEPVTASDVVTPESDGGYGFVLGDTSMQTVQHRINIMYAPIDRVTLVASLGWIDHTKEEMYRLGHLHDGRSDSFYVLTSQGVVDPSFKALVRLFSTDHHHLHVTVGSSFPLGSIDERGRDSTRGSSETVLPYPMQIGSGTFDLVSGLTYRGVGEGVGWGIQAHGTIPLGANEHGYAHGEMFEASAWGSALWTDSLSSFLVVQGTVRRNIRGFDERIRPRFSPQGNPDAQAERSIYALLGLAIDGEADGPLEDLRMELFAGAPLYRYRSGPQLATDVLAGFSLKYLFDF